MTQPEKFSPEIKGLPIEECVAKAQKYIEENGVCLFLFDVKESKKYPDRQALQKKLFLLIQDLNQQFAQYFPENSLATCTRKEKGFCNLLGDGSWVGINDALVIPMIANYVKENYPDLSLYYGVAKNGYDQATKIVK
ncbi:MAG TPA: hypothetical protein PLQ50_02040 [Candidatus Woesebacteria bacterium]|nr:hypothetical protein [Candidatus Woesebacteria bacterium]